MVSFPKTPKSPSVRYASKNKWFLYSFFPFLYPLAHAQ